MYRADWVRINRGRGPTVAQARAEAQYRGEAGSEIARARAEYERLNSAWQASDKTQDDDAIRCDKLRSLVQPVRRPLSRMRPVRRERP
jgi:hypothetical protein